MAAPKKQEKPQSKDSKEDSQGITKKQLIALVIFAAIVVAASFTFSYGTLTSTGGNANLTSFWNHFASANRAGIVVSYSNATVFSSSLPCATALIQKIIETPGLHRNSSTMDFYVVNGTSCSYSIGLGSTASNSLTTTPSKCSILIGAEPHVLIQYAQYNSTTANSTVLTIQGSPTYLLRCGIASEITSK